MIKEENTKFDNVNIKLKSRINDDTVISTKNLIPNKRTVTRKDVDAFVKKIKEKK